MYIKSKSNAPILVTYGNDSRNVLKITRSYVADFTSRNTRPIRNILNTVITFKLCVGKIDYRINSMADIHTIQKSNILLLD